MYIRSRLRQWPSGYQSFLEVGSGVGILSQVFLDAGYSGRGFDLNQKANKLNALRNANAVSEGRYRVECRDFMESGSIEPVDFIASSFVIEHLELDLVAEYFRKARSLLKPGGRILTIVPGDPRSWGVEDQVAGHVRRYDRKSLQMLADSHRMQILDLRGLTWPLSNMLLPVSNFLVRRAEIALLDHSLHHRTIASGYRDIKFKTTFPLWSKIFLNSWTLAPFHAMQLAGARSSRCLVLYCEMSVMAR
jgi:SAM-dependent methyltransferase